MALDAGSKLGQYEIIGQLGQGGMGAVYRARDTKLGRDVAIKVVLEAFVADRERLARFEREARTLAALNHPNVATLYGKEESNGQHFLVMELVDGSTLADIIGRSAGSKDPASKLTLETTLKFAVQIAEGLEAAHEKGIVHRDLKPANIKVTADEKVKVLDFGLATASDTGTGGATNVSIANSPTVTSLGTQAGMILGTASYMSPEQARGMAADHRSDVFSFGVVLYEMLTGRQPFPGETISDVLASVLARDPDLSSLPADIAPRLADLVKRCLEKHPRKRWQAIGDVRHELEQIAANPRKSNDAAVVAATAAALLQPKPFWRRALPIALTAVAAAGITWAVVTFTRRAPRPAPVSRFTILYGEDQQRTSLIRPSLAISPDGTRIAYLANRQIQIREIDALETRAIASTVLPSGAGTPIDLVLSPQGTAVAYYEIGDATVKQVSLAGGLASTVCSAPSEVPNGLSWYGDFIYVTTVNGIVRCLETGGQPELVVKKDPVDAVTRPQVLPDGRLLFSVSKPVVGSATTDRWLDAAVVVQGPGDDAPKVLFKGGSDPRYVPSGHLLYVAGGILYARTFDPRSLAFGTAVPVVEGILRTSGAVGGGTWWYDVSNTGTLVYQPGVVGATSALRISIGAYERTGNVETLKKIPPGPYADPRISPDGRHLAYTVDDGRDVSIWVVDMAGPESPRRLTFGGHDRFPVWSADNKHVIFQSDREGDLALYMQAADGGGTAARLTKPAKDAAHVARSASPDGAVLLFDESQNNETTLMAFSFKEKTSAPFGGVRSMMPTGAVFSPNGRWVAYAQRDKGQTRSAVFVQPYPATGAKFQISASNEDGHHQMWARDGKELFYTPGPGTDFMSLSVNTTGATFSYGPGVGFKRTFLNSPPSSERPFDVTKNAEGEPLIIGLPLTGADPTRPERVENRVVLNWFEELKARVK